MDRRADVFIVSKRSWLNASIKHVLSLRQEEVRRAPASSQGQDAEAVILDKGARFRVEKVLYNEYLRETETQELAQQVWERAVRSAEERRALGERSSAKDLYERSMRSYWKTTVFNRYGGEVWLSTLIATGRVHAISVQIVNEIYAERIRAQAGREPMTDPGMAAPRTDALASSQGPGQVRGVQHHKKYTGKLRDQARHADKKWGWHDSDWWQAHRRGHLSARDAEWWSSKSAQLKQEADRLWAEATEESNKVGLPFKGRDGTMVSFAAPPHVGTVERSLQILRERIEKGEVTWPPRP